MPLILVYGLGAFGYAILKHLDRHKRSEYTIAGFDRDRAVTGSLRRLRSHPYINSGHKISREILITEEVEESYQAAHILILAITAQSIPEVVKKLSSIGRSKKLIIVNAAKALDATSGDRLELMIKKHYKQPFSYVYFAGGTIADDLYNSHPLGATIASRNKQALVEVEKLLASPNLRLYPTSDVSGVEYCAAFKNVVSIFAGIVSGLGWPYGSETFFISRFSREIERFVTRELHGRLTTFTMDSQCWGNDLWMSCTGKTRNREFGILIGQGLKPKQAEQKMLDNHKTVEGLTTLRVISKLTDDLKKYPFLSATHTIVLKGADPAKTIKELIESRKV